jgi:hypothetical protein
MPHYTRPEHIRDYFDQYQISISTKPSTVKKGIESAEALGFRHTTNDVGDVIVITPLQHRKVYRGFGKARYQLCAVLMHAMFSSVMH